jgi:hypothetical protein
MAAQQRAEPLALVTLLRKQLTAQRARLVVGQAELRRRAAEKFTLAERMFFTPAGLEQATDEVVARYKASRFPAGLPIADLCCGIGGDLIALASRGPVVGVERDPATAALAAANLRVAIGRLPLTTAEGWGAAARDAAEAIIADAASFHVADCVAWHIDPDRRPSGRRTTRVELHEPGPDVIARLLHDRPNAAVKLAPAADFSINTGREKTCVDNLPWAQAGLEWISRKRQCRQLVAWFGSLAELPGRRRATRLSHNLSAREPELVVASFVGSPDVELPVAGSIGRYLFEPDAAVLAAHLTGALAADLQMYSVAGGVGYLTADEPRDSPLLDGFEVLDVMPYHVKALKTWLRARGIGRLEVKKRGVDLDPARVQRELHVPGDEQAALIVCRIRGKMTAILTHRVVGPLRSARCSPSV